MSTIGGPRHPHHHHHVHGQHHAEGPKGPVKAPETQGITFGERDPNGPAIPIHLRPFPFPDLGHGPCHCLPPPSPEQSAAPAGSGLSTGDKANPFGPNAITTAGGYTIVPEGKDQSWDIYAPGQKPGDTPNSHIWGDPHVTEKDGTKWDFTRNSSFKLPDGTNIAVSTVPYNGDESHRLSSTLDITNGADHVQVTGIDQNKPVVGKVTYDGYQSRAELSSQDTFTLGGDKDNVKWFKSVDGKNQGEITGASMVKAADGTSAYEQTVKAGDYAVDPSLQPKPGTKAWDNELRDAVVDACRNEFGAKSYGAEVAASLSLVAQLTSEQADQAKAAAEAAAKQAASQLENFTAKLGKAMWLFNFMDVSPRHHHHSFLER